jgi:hypothetical protein
MFHFKIINKIIKRIIVSIFFFSPSEEKIERKQRKIKEKEQEN